MADPIKDGPKLSAPLVEFASSDEADRMAWTLATEAQTSARRIKVLMHDVYAKGVLDGWHQGVRAGSEWTERDG